MTKKYIFKFFLITWFFSGGNVYSDNHNVLQILETLKQDIKTLERAVYSNSFKNENSNQNGEVRLGEQL